MNIIDERDIRTIHRRLKKKEFDDKLQLSTSGGQWVRLLDEGVVVDASGHPLFVIRKGTLRAFYERLADDYVGSINLGHMEFATFPILIGRWTKQDIRLVDIGDGREALDVNLRLNESLSIVQDLRKMDYTLGVSAEFGFHRDEENTKRFGIEVLDEVNIMDFAIVGEAGNVNSSGIQLKGESMTLQELSAELDKKEVVSLEDINKKLDALEPGKEEPEKEEPVKEESAKEEEPKEKTLNVIGSLMENLTKENQRLAEENAKLTAELAARDKAEHEFVEKFKSLSISLSTESVAKDVDEQPTNDVGYTDGIGEI